MKYKVLKSNYLNKNIFNLYILFNYNFYEKN